MGKATGGFFAVGADVFDAACELGMNPAVSLLVMARGTGRDNSTTKWSALSVFNRTGMARRRATDAINALVGAALVDVVKAGNHPQYKLHKPADDDSLLWLPNELIDGAGAEIPPITKLREAGSLDLLKKFVQLYGIQDLDSDGGLPRDIAWVPFERELICPIGHFNLYGFNAQRANAFPKGIFADYRDIEDDDGNKGPWVILSPLLQMGLLEKAFYMAESAEPDAELIYPVNPVTADAMDDLCGWLNQRGGDGFAYKTENFETQGVALKHIKNASMVGLYRLRYRPKTGKTSRWLALDMERTEAMSDLVRQMIGHEDAPVVHIKALQCS